MERLRFYREFDDDEYVSENGNISVKISGEWVYIYIYIHKRGNEFMTLKTHRSYKFEDIGVSAANDFMSRLRYVYYDDEHHHSPHGAR